MALDPFPQYDRQVISGDFSACFPSELIHGEDGSPQAAGLRWPRGTHPAGARRVSGTALPLG